MRYFIVPLAATLGIIAGSIYMSDRPATPPPVVQIPVYLRSIDYDGHRWIQSSNNPDAWQLIHHPDCPCHAAQLEKP
jgi:hypothetical protein